MKALILINDPPNGTGRSTMDELADVTIAADKVMVF